MPGDSCVGWHMPGRRMERIAHAALTNHRIPARPGAPPEGSHITAGPSDPPGLDLLDAAPGEPALPITTRLAGYGELMARVPALQASYFDLLQLAARADPDNPLGVAALGRKAMAEDLPAAARLMQ